MVVDVEERKLTGASLQNRNMSFAKQRGLDKGTQAGFSSFQLVLIL